MTSDCQVEGPASRLWQRFGAARNDARVRLTKAKGSDDLNSDWKTEASPNPVSKKPKQKMNKTCSANVLCFRSGGAFMSKAQGGLLYGAIAVLGAAYGVFEQPQAIDRFTDSMKEVWLPLMKEILPFSLLLILALVVYGLFRAAGLVLERLNGVSTAAHSTLHRNYGVQRKG
jgi:hypothetical protein